MASMAQHLQTILAPHTLDPDLIPTAIFKITLVYHSSHPLLGDFAKDGQLSKYI